MHFFTFIASWVIVGWVVFFAALPFGIKPPKEPTRGNDPGAPERPLLLIKAFVSAMISLVIMGIIWVFIKLGWLDFYHYFGGGRGGVDGLR